MKYGKLMKKGSTLVVPHSKEIVLYCPVGEFGDELDIVTVRYLGTYLNVSTFLFKGTGEGNECIKEYLDPRLVLGADVICLGEV